ncbi:permease [Candidatus Methanomassiliicoccus intestinalis]|uniref:permease n=1 Tax=Candidatus Methanomassiliicoccus intestinalis TaxID=1406512 RepID=UPI0037DC4FE7
MSIAEFVQDQVLGMQWLNSLISTLLSSLGIDVSSQLGGSLQFFIYDTIKIIILLVVLIFVISYIQSYFPPERTKEILGRIGGLKANVMGALLGTVTPFCSCSSIPIFIGFTKAGLPLGVTFSFLISSPLVDLGALVILTSIFGIEVAVIYVIVGIIMAVIGGYFLERRYDESQIEEFARPEQEFSGRCCCQSAEDYRMTTKERLNYSLEQVSLTLKKVFPYVLIGVFIGALIHNWIPADIIQAVLGDNNPFSVIIATLIGVPVYADIFGTIPIAEALLSKGVQIGTILAFMMSVTIVSIPSLVLLKTVLKKKLLFAFVGFVIVGVIVIGYLFNFLL